MAHGELRRDEDDHQDGAGDGEAADDAEPPGASRPRPAGVDEPLERDRRHHGERECGAHAGRDTPRTCGGPVRHAERDEGMLHRGRASTCACRASPTRRVHQRRGSRARTAARTRPSPSRNGATVIPSSPSDRTTPVASATSAASPRRSRAKPGVRRHRCGVHPPRQRHAERELRQPRDEDRAPRPGIEVVVEQEQTRGASHEPDRQAGGQESRRAEPAERGPQQRVHRAQLDQQPDVPPRRREVVELVRRHPHPQQIEPERALRGVETAPQEQARHQEEEMGRPPQRIDAQRAPAPEVAQRRASAPTLRASSPQVSPKPPTIRKSPHALVAGPADPAHQIRAGCRASPVP